MGLEDSLRQRNVVKEVGHKLVDICGGVLSENLGRAPRPEELAELAEIMASELMSGGYLVVRDKGGGPSDAESWLRKTLAMTAATVRLRGSDALIKIDVSIRDVPNKIAVKPPPDAGEQVRKALAPSTPCECAKDVDGRCPSCAPKLAAQFQKFFDIFREMAQFKDAFKDLCKACQREQLDYAISTIVGTLFDIGERLEGDKKSVFAQEMLALLYQMATMNGVSEMPLTIKAWKETVEAKGIPIEGV